MVIIRDVTVATKDIGFSSLVLEYLKEQWKQGICDVKIICASKSYSAHSYVLSAVSPYFKTLLSDGYSKANEDKVTVADLSSFSGNCIKFLLNILYDNIEIDESDEGVEFDIIEFMQLVDYLQIKCSDQLVYSLFKDKMKLENCLDIFLACQQFSFKKLQKFARAKIAKNLYHLSKLEKWKKVPSASAKVIIMDPYICHFAKDLVTRISRPKRFVSLIRKNLPQINALIKSLNNDKIIVVHSKSYPHWEKPFALLNSKQDNVNGKIFPLHVDKPLQPKCVFFVYENGIHAAIIEQDEYDLQCLTIKKYDCEIQSYLKKDICNYSCEVKVNASMKYVNCIFHHSDSRYFAIVSDDHKLIVINFDIKNMTMPKRLELPPLDGYEQDYVYGSSSNLIHLITKLEIVTVNPITSNVQVCQQNDSVLVLPGYNASAWACACIDSDIHLFIAPLIDKFTSLYVYKLDMSSHEWRQFDKAEFRFPIYRIKSFVLDGQTYLLLGGDHERSEKGLLNHYEIYRYDSDKKNMSNIHTFKSQSTDLNILSVPRYLLDLH